MTYYPTHTKTQAGRDEPPAARVTQHPCMCRRMVPGECEKPTVSERGWSSGATKMLTNDPGSTLPGQGPSRAKLSPSILATVPGARWSLGTHGMLTFLLKSEGKNVLLGQGKCLNIFILMSTQS